ncbi:unnamed protein product, partial [Ectocarpus sp. 12 AP-2014]
MLTIAHIVDDHSPDDVARYIDFIATHPGMKSIARHEVIQARRNRFLRAVLQADVIVSHQTLTRR